MRSEVFARKRRLPIVAAVVFSVVIAGITYVLVNNGSGPGRSPASPASESPALPQAAWQLHTFAAGTAGSPSKADRRLVAKERAALADTIMSVADALVLDPGSLEGLGGKQLTQEVVAALAKSGLASPEGLTDIRSLKRTASIGLDSNGGTRAAARVKLVIEAMSDTGLVGFVEETNLFLRKRGGAWQVVAFDGEIKPREPKGAGS